MANRIECLQPSKKKRGKKKNRPAVKSAGDGGIKQ